MISAHSWIYRVGLSLTLPLLIAGCGQRVFGPPVTPPSKCALQWDWVDNLAVTEYRITVWPDRTTPDPTSQAHRVQAPTTVVSCASVGANHDGTWWATVRACTKKGTCSAPSAPFTFIVSSK